MNQDFLHLCKRTLKSIRWSSVLWVLSIGYVLFLRAPLWIANFQAQGTPAPVAQVGLLAPSEIQRIDVPLSGRKQVLVFWATWCGPCKVELARLNNLISKGKLDSKSVLAVSVGEDESVVRSFASQEGYQFLVALDPQRTAAEFFKVAGTPTILFIDEKGSITWKTMGISPSLELRLLNEMSEP